MKGCYTVFFVFLVLMPLALHSQEEYYFSHLSRENGLPSNRIRCMLQDFTGYVWIGTDNGLARFDGKNLRVFTHDKTDTSSVLDNIVNAFLLSHDSLLWIAAYDGLSVYDPKTGNYTNYPCYGTGRNHFPLCRPTRIFEDHDRSLWIGTDEGLVHMTRHPLNFQAIHLKKSEIKTDREFFFDHITQIIQDPQDSSHLIITTLGGILNFNKRDQSISKDYKKIINNGYGIIDVYLEDHHLLWSCGWGTGLNCLDLKTGSWREFPSNPLTPISIIGITPKGPDEFWLATIDNGLGIFNKRSGRFIFIRKDLSREKSLISNSVTAVKCMNSNSDLWISSEEGISILNTGISSFHYRKIPYPSYAISAFYHDIQTKKLYVGGINSKGLYEFDETTNNWMLILPETDPGKDGFSINGFFKDSRGILWMSTHTNLYYLDLKRRKIVMFRFPGGMPLPMKEPWMYCLYEDRANNLWIGTRHEGVFRIDAERKSFTHFLHQPSDSHSLINGGRIRAICQDKQGKIWIGSDNGISIFDPVSGRFFNDFMDTLIKNGITKRWINGIEQDSLGRLWITIDVEGLLRVTEKKNGSFELKLISAANGLNDPSIGKMAKDPSGGIWLINYGLVHIDPYNESIHFFNEHNGLTHALTYDESLYIDPEGTIYLGDKNGFEIRNIRELDFSLMSINLILESFEVNGNSLPLGRPGGSPTGFRFRADQNNLHFRYAAICYHDVDQIRFKYKLEGFDNYWILAGTGLEVRYTNLPPGEYRFIIKVSNRGTWLEQEQSVKFVILPFFWKTWWFMLSLILFISLVIVLIYQYRIRQMVKMERLRTRISSDLHDDVGSTLSSISILSDILVQGEKDPQSLKMISTVGSNAHRMLEKIDDIIWMVSPTNDRFQNLGLRIREFAIPLFETKNIRFIIEYEKQLAKLPLPMEVRRNIYLIAKEAINNVIKYAGCNSVEITIRPLHQGLIMVIADNGIGFDTGKPSSRNGLNNMKQRAEQIKGILKIDSAPGNGTRIIFELKAI